MSINRLQYRLARKEHGEFLAWGDRYPTKQAARDAAPTVNRERKYAGLEPLDHVLTLPSSGSDGLDPSHYLNVEPL